MARGQKQARFTIYLIKDEFSKASDILKAPFDSYPVRLRGKRFGTLYVRAPGRKEPSWLSLFAEVVEGLPKRLFNQHTAAVLLLSVKGRSFAVTFGYGWALLRLEAIQDKFGLRVALNSIDPEKIKSVDRTRLDALTSKTRSQSTIGGTQDQFGIRPEQDLLRAIVGIPREKDLGSPIAGAESLQLHLPADVARLPKYLEKALGRHESTAYRGDFEWIDYVSVVRDPSLRTKLEENLSQALAARDFSAMYLAIPDIIDICVNNAMMGVLGEDAHAPTQRLRRPPGTPTPPRSHAA